MINLYKSMEVGVKKNIYEILKLSSVIDQISFESHIFT